MLEILSKLYEAVDHNMPYMLVMTVALCSILLSGAGYLYSFIVIKITQDITRNIQKGNDLAVKQQMIVKEKEHDYSGQDNRGLIPQLDNDDGTGCVPTSKVNVQKTIQQFEILKGGDSTDTINNRTLKVKTNYKASDYSTTPGGINGRTRVVGYQKSKSEDNSSSDKVKPPVRAVSCETDSSSSQKPSDGNIDLQERVLVDLDKQPVKGKPIRKFLH